MLLKTVTFVSEIHRNYNYTCRHSPFWTLDETLKYMYRPFYFIKRSRKQLRPIIFFKIHLTLWKK